MLIVAVVIVHPKDENPINNWAVCLAVALTIPFIHDLSESLLTRAAKHICEYSYSSYLTHVAALWLAFVGTGTQSRVLQLIVFVFLFVGFAVASYHFIERPMMNEGARVARTRFGSR